MLNSETNSNRRQSSTFMETLQDKLKDIKNFSNWSAKEQMVAVTAVGVIFGALLPVVAVALPVAATDAAVALTLFFAVKAVEYGYKGLKWSAEKTWEGAKYTARKIKAGYEHSVDSLKRGSGKVKSAIGSALETVGHRISSTGEDMNTSYKLTDSTDTGVLLLTEDGKKEYNSINANYGLADKERAGNGRLFGLHGI
ncbi:MAG: actin-bundling T4SS effector WalE1 family protein [Wolbachia sp.]